MNEAAIETVLGVTGSATSSAEDFTMARPRPLRLVASGIVHLARGMTPASDARLRLPLPDEVGGWGLFAADDGSTAVDFAPEGPASPIMTVGALPMAAPMLEWDQWRVAHVAVSFGSQTAEVLSFVPGSKPSLRPLPVDPTSAAAALRTIATAEQLRPIAAVDVGGGEPDHRVGTLIGGAQQWTHDSTKAGQTGIDTGRIDPTGVHGLQRDRRRQVGSEIRDQFDLAAFGSGVSDSASAVAGQHLDTTYVETLGVHAARGHEDGSAPEVNVGSRSRVIR